jgi:hypothetical protein
MSTELEKILECKFETASSDERNVIQQESKNLAKIEPKDTSSLVLEMKKLSQLIGGNTTYISNLKETKEHLSVNFDSSILLNSYTELLSESKELMSTITYIISSSGIIDSEAINAAAALINSVRAVISDMIQIYRDHLKHKGQIQLQQLKGEQKMKEIEYKHKLQLDLIEEIKRMELKEGSIPTEEMVDYSNHEVFNKI